MYPHPQINSISCRHQSNWILTSPHHYIKCPHNQQATEPPRTKKFDIRNEGMFAFVFVLTAEGAMEPEAKNALLSATPPSLLTEPAPATPVSRGLKSERVSSTWV